MSTEGAQEPRTVQPLAEGQRRVLRVIQQYQEAYGHAPTVAFVALRLGLHHSTVQEALRAACRKGWLKSPSPSGLLVRLSG